MPSHHRDRSTVFRVLLMAWLFCAGSVANGQAPVYGPPTPQNAEPVYQSPTPRKTTFKHAKAADVLQILQQLAGEDVMDRLAVDERTNSLIYLADDHDAGEFEIFSGLLDTETPDPSTGLKVSAPALGPQPQVFSFSMGFARGESPESLKQRYNDLEQQTHQLADKLNKSTSLSDSQRTELQLAVRKSFEARQALQRAELADLAQRMQSMQQSIDMRDKLADKVVQRRVEDLLNPNLKWEVTRTSNESTRSISKEDSISPSTITSSQEIQAALQGTWTVRAFQADNMGDDRVSQVVIRGDLLLMHTIVKGKVLGVSPWRLVWPNAEKPYELGVIWDPNSNAESNSATPGRIAYDGKSFQLAWGENPNAICPGEKITYIDCVRANIDDRSTATADTEAAADSSLLSDSNPIFNTPQELLDAVDRHGKSGSYEDIVTLFNEEGVRDLAGILLMSALQLTGSVDLAKTQGAEASSGMDSGVSAVSEVLKRWLPQSANAEQLKAMHDGLSTIWSAIGGASEDPSALKAFRISMRKSVEGITDHRKFCVEIMQAYEKLTTKPFVYFGNGDQKSDWQVTQFGDRATATLIDGSPGMARTITLQQGIGDCRISSLFNELVDEAQPVTASPKATGAEESNSKMIINSKRRSSMVTNEKSY